MNDTLPLTKLLQAELTVCSFQVEVKYSFSKRDGLTVRQRRQAACFSTSQILIIRLEFPQFELFSAEK